MDRTNRSTEIAELAGALAKAQGVIKAAIKDSVNPHLKNRYADLASVWDACREALSANGIAIVQDPSFNGEIVRVVTTMLHTSGQWWESILEATPAQTTLQQIGAAITYLRRYALSSLVGIAPDDDDDANAASDQAQQFSQREDTTPRNDFAPNMRDEAIADILASRTVADLDDLAPKLNSTKWRNAADKNEVKAEFAKQRAQLVAAEREPCRACDLVGKHAKDCPNDPKNAPKPAPATV